MALIHRTLEPLISRDLRSKMVFVGGPRQVGKTRLGQAIIPEKRAYLNYDIPAHREAILTHRLPPTSAWFFDEIHKYREWRNFLKGLYDSQTGRQILVTGSARLDFYRYGGDSLQGRYFHLRLHPLSFAEISARTADDVQTLLRLSGFPEPFVGGDEALARRWSLAYRERLIHDEITSLEVISDLAKLELLALTLPSRVGSPLSLNSLREDLQVSHATVSRWLEVLERLYAVFRIAPFGAPMLRAVRKEQKHYHFDWTVVPNLPERFENLIAAHLLKWAHYQVDTQGHAVELRFYRDVDGREVDFVLTHDARPIAFVEAKWDDAEPSASLRYLRQRFPGVPSWQVSAVGSDDYENRDGIRVAPAHVLLSQLV